MDTSTSGITGGEQPIRRFYIELEERTLKRFLFVVFYHLPKPALLC
jgi:hypothetical protein